MNVTSPSTNAAVPLDPPRLLTAAIDSELPSASESFKRRASFGIVNNELVLLMTVSAAAVGASLTAGTATVLVTALLRLFALEPSLTCQVMVRADVEGLSLVFW